MNQKVFRHSNRNHNFSLISRDCVGGILYHQLGLKFLSPTINLFIKPEEFCHFCLHLKHYIKGKLVEDTKSGETYPVGLLIPKKRKLKPIHVYFMHYDSYLEASNKWNERKKRINWRNLFVLNTICYPREIEEITPELIFMWNKIKYKKVVIVDKKYGFDDEYVINKPEECKEYAWLLFEKDKENPFLRTFNDFDFIKFLNK